MNLLLNLPANAQASISPTTITSLSFSGFNFSIGATAKKNKFQAYMGPKIALSKSEVAGKGPFGLVTSLMFFPNGQKKRFSGFINMDYQFEFSKAFCSSGNCPRKTNLVHEYTLGYGFVFQIKRVGLLNVINIGRYTENFFNHSTGERFTNSGYNTLIKVGVSVKVSKMDRDG